MLLRALGRLDRLARRDLPVLILGETGTGKELAARFVHASSRRAGRPFVAVNCAALSEPLLLSDLFGHVRGAFTGADRDRAGVFESARRGTVFLDEIGELPASAQGMLLRTLQEGEIRRVGESLPRRVDVRVLAATHRDLVAESDRGAFRTDLYYRLAAGVVELPPLRDRPGDLMALAAHVLLRFTDGGVLRRLSPGAKSKLLAYHWPGNVRQLENVLSVADAMAGERAVIRSGDVEIPETEAVAAGYHARIRRLRSQLVREAMIQSGWNGAEAARRLGLSRQALSYLVRNLGIRRP